MLQLNKGAVAEEYKYVTPEFIHAVETVNNNSFFSLSVGEILNQERGAAALPEARRKRAEMGLISYHYRTVGDGLCGAITSSYIDLMKEKYNGDAAYNVDREIIDIMRRTGAFTLPIQAKKGWFEVVYSRISGGALDSAEFQKAYNNAEPFVRSFGKIKVLDKRNYSCFG